MIISRENESTFWKLVQKQVRGSEALKSGLRVFLDDDMIQFNGELTKEGLLVSNPDAAAGADCLFGKEPNPRDVAEWIRTQIE